MTSETANKMLVISAMLFMTGVFLLYRSVAYTPERGRADSGSVAYTRSVAYTIDLNGLVGYVLDPGDRLLSVQDSAGKEICAVVFMPDGGAEVIGKAPERCMGAR